jgi:glycosyltransferase involved in cell wall biosynthesis
MRGKKAELRITVVTPCLNGVRYLGEAIESVLRQRYPNTEHIVVDGGSTDGTLELLSRYPHLKVLKGPDRGVYDAINKALAVAEGEIIGVLNSDDCYADDVFFAVNDDLTDEDVMALAGDAISFRGAANAPHSEVDRFTNAGRDLLYHSTLGNPSINAWFFRASVFASLGGFDAAYRVAGDREFMLRLACSGLRCAQLSKLVYQYRIHPDSMTFGGNEGISETIGREHDKMTDEYLHKRGLSKRARGLIRQARTRDTLRLAIRSAQRHHWRRLIFYSAAGTRHDPIWPLRFAKRAMAAFGARLRCSH